MSRMMRLHASRASERPFMACSFMQLPMVIWIVALLSSPATSLCAWMKELSRSFCAVVASFRASAIALLDSLSV